MADARTPLLLDVFATWCVRGSVRERVRVRGRVRGRVRVRASGQRLEGQYVGVLEERDVPGQG